MKKAAVATGLTFLAIGLIYLWLWLPERALSSLGDIATAPLRATTQSELLEVLTLPLWAALFLMIPVFRGLRDWKWAIVPWFPAAVYVGWNMFSTVVLIADMTMHTQGRAEGPDFSGLGVLLYLVVFTPLAAGYWWARPAEIRRWIQAARDENRQAP
jgi:hypothetical protein